MCISNLPAVRLTTDALQGGAVLTSPVPDPELPAIELQAAHSRAGKGRWFPSPPG